MVIMLEVVNVDEDHNLPFRFATKPLIQCFVFAFEGSERPSKVSVSASLLSNDSTESMSDLSLFL